MIHNFLKIIFSKKSSLTFSNDTYNDYDTDTARRSRNSKNSTSNNSSKNEDSKNSDLNTNLLNFDMFESVNSKSSTNSILNSNSDDSTNKNADHNLSTAEDDDPFGFGMDSLELHRKSLINTSNIKDGSELNR